MEQMTKRTKDLTGQIFGELEVIEFSHYQSDKNVKKRSAYFKCKCTCGEIVIRRAESLKAGFITTCNIIGKHLKTEPVVNLIGQKIGKLLVLDFAGFEEIKEGNRTKRLSSYNCICDCGNKKIATQGQLATIKSCGCGQKDLYDKKIQTSLEKMDCKTEEELLWKRYYLEYKKYAIKRKYSFNISLEEFINIANKNCFYCGQEPKINSQTKKRRNHLKSNGLDRQNNKIGYEIDNLVSCCKMCNISKYKYSLEEWYDWLDKIAKYRNTL